MRRALAGVFVVLFMATFVLGCGNGDSSDSVKIGIVEFPESVRAGDVFTIAVQEGWKIRASHVLARFDGGPDSWVLNGVSDGETPSSRQGEAVEDVLDVSVQSLEFAFSVDAAAGTYNVCLSISPDESDTEVENVCQDISVS